MITFVTWNSEDGVCRKRNYCFRSVIRCEQWLVNVLSHGLMGLVRGVLEIRCTLRSSGLSSPMLSLQTSRHWSRHTHTNTRTSVWERSGVKQTQMRLLLQVFRQVLLHHLQKERSQYLTMTETVNGYTSAPWTEKNCSLQRSIQLKHILEHAQKNLKHSEGNIRWDRLWGHISSPRLPLCWSETVEEEHNNKL